MNWRFWRWETPKTRRLREQLRETEAALQDKKDKLVVQVEKRKGLTEALREEVARRTGTQARVEELQQIIAEAAQRVEGLHTMLKVLSQTTHSDDCKKIQLRDRAEAVRMAIEVERNTGCGNMEPYKCPVCPRHPFTGEYFWHIRHVEREERGLVYAPRQMRHSAIGRRVNPTVMANLRKKTKDEDNREAS